MLWNLLLVDPDNIPDGIGKASDLPYYILAITIIAILAIIIAACVIRWLYKNSQNPEIKEKNGLLPYSFQ